MSELYRDFIDNEMDDIITALNGTITPTPVNSELYRNFLNRKADDIITALNGTITPAPIGDELYRDFIERKFDDVISSIGSYIPPVSFPSVSGAVCSFDSQYAGLPLKAHTVAVNAVQASGTLSPANPLPISGWSAITITANSVPTVIQIGSTVYGGTYDAITGILTVTHLYIKGSDINFTNLLSAIPAIYGAVSGVKNTPNDEVADLICDTYQTVSRANIGYASPYSSGVCVSGNYIMIADTSKSWATLNEAKEDVKNVNIVYPLATPTTIQLPPCPIDTLEGVNNIFADTGDTTLQYIKIGGNT